MVSLLSVCSLLASSVLVGTPTQEDLRLFTEQAIQNSSADVEHPTSNVVDGVFVLKMGGIWNLDGFVDPVDPMAKPLRAQFISTLIRRHRNKGRQRQGWQPVLEAVEAEIAAMLQDIETLEPDARDGSLAMRVDRIEELYRVHVQQSAKAAGYADGELAYAAAIRIATCDFVVTPEAGTVQCIPAGRLDLYHFMKARKADVPEPRWEDITNRTGRDMSVGMWRIRFFSPNSTHPAWDNPKEMRIKSDSVIQVSASGLKVTKKVVQ